MKLDRGKVDHVTGKPFKKFKCRECGVEILTVSIDNGYKVCPKCDIKKVKDSG